MRGCRYGVLHLALPVALALGAGVDADPAQATRSDAPRLDRTAPGSSHKPPYDLVRDLAELQEHIVSGRQEAASRQGTLAREIGDQLALVDASAWSDARNRMGLVKYVLMGGDPEALERRLTETIFPEAELSVARGVLAYARGRRAAAAEHLETVEPRFLGPSLAGHIALIKAILVRDTNGAKARRFCDEARLLSPGTAVEEAALRLAIDMAIAQGDAIGFDQLVLRYTYRFPQSLYRPKLDARVARILAARRHDSDRGFGLATSLAEQLPDAERSNFYSELAEAALRAGNAAIATRAARSAVAVISAIGGATAALRAIEGAALVTGPARTQGLHVLADAEAANPSASTRDLIAAARRLAAAIGAGPDRIDPTLFTSDRRSAEGDGADSPDRSARAITIVTHKLSQIDALLEGPAP
jgi:chemotaxis protein MotC